MNGVRSPLSLCATVNSPAQNSKPFPIGENALALFGVNKTILKQEIDATQRNAMQCNASMLIYVAYFTNAQVFA